MTTLYQLVFDSHVVVRRGKFGTVVDASNFARLVRRGKRHIAADKEMIRRRTAGTQRT